MLLEIEHLHCSVLASPRSMLFAKRSVVLSDISLSVGQGEVLGLVGKSGSGKSTLARCIAGLQKPDGGSIVFRSVNIFPHEKNRKRFSAEIQMVFQANSASLDPMMTVRECLIEGAEARLHAGAPNIEEVLCELLEATGLEKDLLTCFPGQLSGGQRQRIAIARALAAQPSLLILDEPTSALDLLTQRQVLSLLRRVRQQFRLSILLISHDIGIAMSACDRIAVLHDGVIVEDAAPHTLASYQQHPFTWQLFSDSLLSS